MSNAEPQARSAVLSDRAMPQAAYVHLPFCRRRCYYCDFPISVVGERTRGETSTSMQAYVDAVCREIAIAPQPPQPLKTVFFGGGTPSLISVAQLEQLLAALAQRLGIAAGAEISMEMDPGTFNASQLQGFLAAGVNRVSLGIQSFDPETLATCGRAHTVEDSWAAIALLLQAEVENFSLDLMSGLPQQTLAQWQTTLETAIGLGPAHLSTYDLIVEPKTVFERRYTPGAAPLPTDEIAAQMYRLTHQLLIDAGYEHYEISNHARPGYQCRHNRVYWQNRPYYGFGMGATSYLGGERFARSRTRHDYYQWLDTQPAKSIPPIPEAPNNDEDSLLETLMLGLRLAEGINLTQLRDRFGQATVQSVLARLQPHAAPGWIELLDNQNRPLPWNDYSESAATRLRLTAPEGFLFSNTVLASLFSD